MGVHGRNEGLVGGGAFPGNFQGQLAGKIVVTLN
jgi:hypothetical protein